MESLFFEMEYQDQPVACFHNWFVNLTQLAGVAGASIGDFLGAPGTSPRLDLLAFCALDGNVMTVQMRRPEPHADDGREDEERRDDGTLSDVWAHHAFAYEFLFWHGDTALFEWFMDQCNELCWREDFDDLRYALRRRVDQLQEKLHFFATDEPDLEELSVECKHLAAQLMARLHAAVHTDFDLDDGDQFGHVSPALMVEFVELLGMVSLLAI